MLTITAIQDFALLVCILKIVVSLEFQLFFITIDNFYRENITRPTPEVCLTKKFSFGIDNISTHYVVMQVCTHLMEQFCFHEWKISHFLHQTLPGQDASTPLRRSVNLRVPNKTKLKERQKIRGMEREKIARDHNATENVWNHSRYSDQYCQLTRLPVITRGSFLRYSASFPPPTNDFLRGDLERAGDHKHSNNFQQIWKSESTQTHSSRHQIDRLFKAELQTRFMNNSCLLQADVLSAELLPVSRIKYLLVQKLNYNLYANDLIR